MSRLRTFATRALALLCALPAGCQHFRWQPTAIEGDWASPCLPARAEIGFRQRSVSEIESFDASELRLTQTYFTDDKCATAYFARTVVASYAVGDAVLQPIGARRLELTERRVAVRAASEQAASDLSQQSYCGRSDWQAGVELDVAGASCNGVPTPAAGAIVHQIAQVDGDSLYLGSLASGTGANEATRPTVLSKTAYQRRR